MNEPPPSDFEDIQQELKALRLILRKNLRKLKQNHDPILGQQLYFWVESAKILEKELEIWEETGDISKYDQAVERIHKVLGALQELIDQMNNGMGEGKP